MTNSVDPNESALCTHLALHCLHGYLFWSWVMKSLNVTYAKGRDVDWLQSPATTQ